MSTQYHVALGTPGFSWVVEADQGVVPDPVDLVQLADGWSYSWAWESGVIPGQLEPSTASCKLLCRTADDVPAAVEVGNLLALQVFVTGPYPPVSMMDPSSFGASLTPGAVFLASEFTVNTAGTVTGLRFYRAAADDTTTTRPLYLWNLGSGALLGTATTTETVSTGGWVEATLSTPVHLSPLTTYVVSYPGLDGYRQDGTPTTDPTFNWIQGRYDGYVPTPTTPPGGTAGGTNWFADVVFVPDGTQDVYVLDKVLRVSSVEVTLTPPDPDDPYPYAAEVALELVDELAALRNIIIDAPLGIPAGTYGGHSYSYRDTARSWWQPRLAEIAVLANRSIGCPDWWSDENPPPPEVSGTPLDVGLGLAVYNPVTGGWDGKAAMVLLTEVLNSWQPVSGAFGITHAVVPHYGASYPTGYEWVAGHAGGTVVGAQEEPCPTDPATTLRYMVAPAGRLWYDQLHLDGGWLDVPAKARQSREHVVNTIRLAGRAMIADPADPNLVYKSTQTALEFTDATDANTYGPSARDVPTQLRLYELPATPGTLYPAPGVAAPNFYTTDVRGVGYTYEAFTLDSSLMPDDAVMALLPRIAPRWPGEADTSGYLLSACTLVNLDPDIQFGYPHADPRDDVVSGFVKAGTLTVRDGRLVWSLTLTPGVLPS